MQKMLGSALLLNILLIFSVVEAAEFTITLDGQDKFNVPGHMMEHQKMMLLLLQ